jgi:hypothetical protein
VAQPGHGHSEVLGQIRTIDEAIADDSPQHHQNVIGIDLIHFRDSLNQRRRSIARYLETLSGQERLDDPQTQGTPGYLLGALKKDLLR